MTTDNIFGNNQSPTDPATTPTTPNPLEALANQLAAIKNENGEQKYKTLDDALKALQHSQQYIPQLTKTLAEKEAELAQAKAAASKVEELERSVQQLMSPSEPAEQSTNAQPAITPEAIAALVKQTLTQTQVEQTASQNLATVVQAAKTAFGDKADEMFYSKAQTLGMSKEAINSLAATSPAAVLELLGIKQGATPAKPSSGFNTDGFTPNKDTFISRNKNSMLLGATSQDLAEEGRNARAMVDELHSQGLSIKDLTDPKVYFKHFK